MGQIRPMTDTVTRTFEARLQGDRPDLDAMAAVYQRMVRQLYAEARKSGKSVDTFKRVFCARYAVPARIFNAAAIDVKGMTASVREKAKVDAEDLRDKVKRTGRKIGRLRAARRKNGTLTRKQHAELVGQYRRRDKLKARLARAEKVSDQTYPALCFGGRKLFKAQHHLTETRFAGHGDWKNRWRDARADAFLVVGSSDEVAGNKTCKATVRSDGAVDLRLAGPDGGEVRFEGVRLPHGHDVWCEAIDNATREAKSSRDYQAETKRQVAEHKRTLTWPAGTVAKALREGLTCEKAFRRQRMGRRKAQPKHGAAIAYRFKRDGYGWRLFVTVQQPVASIAADVSGGAVGVDMNADHLAVASVAADGGLEAVQRLDTPVAHKTRGQRADVYRHAAKAVVDRAEAEGRPIVMEKLDFRAKRKRLREIGSAKAARMLSAFATSAFRAALVSRAKRRGVAVVEVNPAFTSVVGATKAKRHGISIHHAAAWAIARRGMDVPETAPHRFAVPDGHRKPVTVPLPADLQGKARGDGRDVWREVASGIKAAREGRLRLPSGAMRRRRRRAERSAADAAFLPAVRSAAPGETPGETGTCRDVPVAGARTA